MANTDSKTGFIKGQIKFAPQPLPNTVAWNEINWRKAELSVYKLQKRIYQASKTDNVRKLRRLQKTLLNSYNAKLLAVRKVSQDNKG
jgi:RNA-directed DNA polymerase